MPYEFKVGFWFYCYAYLVFPRSEKGHQWLQDVGTNWTVDIPARAHAAGRRRQVPPRRDRTDLIDQAGVVLNKRLIDSREFVYNHQLNWSLQEVPARSLREALGVVSEFLEFADHAGREFDWDFTWGMDVRRHAWKHTLFEHIKKSFEALEDLPQLLLGYLGRGPARVFENAAHQDPAAVARLNFLFQSSRERMLEAAGALFNEKTAHAVVNQIPTVRSLAADLADKANRHPDSDMAEDARARLRILASKAAAKGIGGRSGRTAVLHDKDTIAHVFKISYSLHRQLSEVDKFLRRYLELREERSRKLAKHFPDLSRHFGSRLTDLADYQPTQGAYMITGAALGISPSKVEKSVYG